LRPLTHDIANIGHILYTDIMTLIESQVKSALLHITMLQLTYYTVLSKVIHQAKNNENYVKVNMDEETPLDVL